MTVELTAQRETEEKNKNYKNWKKKIRNNLESQILRKN